MAALSALRKDRGVSTHEHKHSYEQEEETQKENGARDLPRPEAVLDDTDAVLAVGERGRGDENRRAAAHGVVQTRTRRVDGVVE